MNLTINNNTSPLFLTASQEEVALMNTDTVISAKDTTDETAWLTVTAVIVGVSIAVAFLFIMAVFIDCRHQKPARILKTGRRAFRSQLPVIVEGQAEDTDCIVDAPDQVTVHI